jgi:hypothetical protein
MGSGDRFEEFMRDDPGRQVTLFTEALKVPLADRRAFLERACNGDPQLLQKVDALLKAHDRVGNFLEEPPGEEEL